MKKPNFQSSVFSFSSKVEYQIPSKVLSSCILQQLQPEHKQRISPPIDPKKNDLKFLGDFLQNILFSAISDNCLLQFLSDFLEVSKYLAHCIHIPLSPPTSYYGSNPVLQDSYNYTNVKFLTSYYIEGPIRQKKMNNNHPIQSDSYSSLIFLN